MGWLITRAVPASSACRGIHRPECLSDYICVRKELNYGLHVLMPVQVSLSYVLLPSQRHLLRKVPIVPPEETEQPTHCFPTQGMLAAVVESPLVMVVAEISINKCFFDALF